MILVTAGAGYIGSHNCVELLNAGHDVVVFDNFSNSHPEALKRVKRITGKTLQVVEGDIRDQAAQEGAIRHFGCNTVIHFAGLKAVGESVEKPLEYYGNNVIGTHRLLQVMGNCGVKTLVFSSSATVYGEPQYLPLTEDYPLSATSPYGRLKLVIEEMLRDLHRSDPTWRIGILCYFNPVGVHESGLSGENSQGILNNLMPFVAQVAIGFRDRLNAWGGDYPTGNGTGVRDYSHIVDMALGHLNALESLDQAQCFEVNQGTRIGYSVLEVIKAFEHACGMQSRYDLAARQAGDIAVCYADSSEAARVLGWKAVRTLETMCSDTWRWHSANPRGFN